MAFLCVEGATGAARFSKGSAGKNFIKVESISPNQRALTIALNRENILSLVGGRSTLSSPYISFPFFAEGNVSCTIQRQNPETIAIGVGSKVSTMALGLVDTAKGQQGFSRASLPGTGNGTVLKQVGTQRGEKVYSLIIYPYDYANPPHQNNSAPGQITYYKNITINLNSNQPFPADFENLANVQNSSSSTSSPESANLGKIGARATTALPTGSFIRIIVNQDGMYHVTGRDLDTSGINISGFTSQNMTLWNHGKQIPIYVYTGGGTQFTGDSYFEFYGTANRVDYSGGREDLYNDPFTDNNVYFLTTDSTAPAQRLVSESGAEDHTSNATDLSGYSFSQVEHLEKDNVFERLDAVDQDQTYDKRDHWFWTTVSSNQMVTVPFYLAYPDTTNVSPLTFTAAFHGITHLGGTAGSPEHQAQLFINQTHVLSTSWNNQNAQIVNVGTGANIPQNVLHNGTNNFQIYDANPGTAAAGTFAFNWAELRYQRLYAADKDYIKFSIPDNAQPGYYNFLVQNFHNSSVSVYRINVSKLTDITIKNLSIQGKAPQYAALFHAYVQSPNEQFIAVSDSGKLKPVRVEQIPNAGLSSHDYSSDYIMIVNRKLDDVTKTMDPSNPVSELSSWYNSHSTKTIVVDADQIYDDFNFGIKSPYAIRSFISYAYHNWSNPPKYVLLAGTGTWNTKNGKDTTNIIPVMMMQTYQFGATACDNFYACVDGADPIPDVAVGRIPASSSDQLKAAIDKILSYYSNPAYGWQNTALLIAGEEEEFHIQADSIVHSIIPPNFFINRLYTSIQNPAVDTKYYGTTQNLVNDFNQGAALVNFMGHGGGAIWADNGILTNDEVANLANSGKYPFVTSMTCFAGAFDGQEGLPLASTLLFAQNKGAVGVLASAGLGWLYNDFFMDTELLPLIFDSTTSDASIGSNLMVAKANYYAAYYFWPQSVTMINQYNLIGDPAFRIQLPAENSSVRLNSYSVSEGQNISGTISNFPAGATAIVQATNLDGDAAAQSTTTLDQSGTFSIPFQGGINGQGHLKVYTYNKSSQSSASIDFSTASAFVQMGNFGITASADKFQITIDALASGSNISSVNFVGGIYPPLNSVGNNPIAALNIPLPNKSQNEYLATILIGADTVKPGDVIAGNIQAKLSDGSTVGSVQASYIVPGAADLAAFPQQGFQNVNPSIKVAADSVVELEAMVYDRNKVAAQNVRIDFYDGTRASGKFLGNGRVSFDTTVQKPVSLPANLSPGIHTIYMYLVFDSLTNGYDLNPQNNYAYNNVTVNFAAANSAGAVAIDSSASLSGASPGEIFLVQRVSPALFPQPSIFPAKSKSGNLQFYQFASLRNSSGESYTVSLKIFNPDSTTGANFSGLHLYIYDPRTQTLNLTGGNYSGDSVSANVSTLGIFAAAYSTDHTPPQITISVGDQFFSDGDFVPPNPRFSFLFHDEDGIDLNTNAMDIELDGNKVPAASIILPDTVTNPTSVTASVQLSSLTNAPHLLEVTAENADGIRSSDSIHFVAKSDFSLKVYGAYPDPFVFQTFIAFEVTSANPIDAVEVKIYTVSGKLVKTIRYPSSNPQETVGLLQGGTGSPTAVGYHEAWWDGTDSYGNQVANGVYFYKVSVSGSGRTLEDIGKMARLR